MAIATGSRPNHEIKAYYVLGGLFSLFLIIQKCDAFEFKVGGSQGWTVPSVSDSYNKWAEKNRFQIGDSLRFVYHSDDDSVLLVSKEDYDNCNTESYVEKFTDGNTVYKFEKAGAHYFISGEKDKCRKNEKMVVIVMADRSNGSSNSIGVSSIIMSLIGTFVGSFILRLGY